MYRSIINVRLPDGQTKAVNLTGLDDATLVGGPPRMIDGDLADLRRADGILVDEDAARDRLAFVDETGSKRALQVGDAIEINDKRAVVVGISQSSKDFILVPKAFTTYTRALSYAPRQRRLLTYVLVKAQAGEDPAALARRIREKTGLKALTRDDFKRVTLGYWMNNTGIPINFGVSVILGFLVGTAVVGQSFYNFVRENLTQYAALKAMGIRSGTLVRMVLLQAVVVGFIGYGLGVGVTAFFFTQAQGGVLAFLMLPEVLLFSATGIFVIVTLSALIGAYQVLRLDPAVVFRS
jgi:putative ABC transport system permease protein